MARHTDENREELLIDAQNIGIQFQRTVTGQRNRLRNSFSSIFRTILSQSKKEKFWALKNISFTLKRGEVIGIIGPNGAGKSTLLKILAQVLIPDEGQVKVYGKISSLLSLGSGFMPLLSGRENIYLNGMYMGMSKAQIDDVYNNIIAFSGLKKFIETPIKHYSLGMKARLGFSVAVHTKPEILIIDEVLSAGDKNFLQKAFKKMDSFLDSAKGIIIASHNMKSIKKYSNKCLLIENGSIVAIDNTDIVLSTYNKLNRE